MVKLISILLALQVTTLPRGIHKRNCALCVPMMLVLKFVPNHRVFIQLEIVFCGCDCLSNPFRYDEHSEHHEMG